MRSFSGEIVCPRNSPVAALKVSLKVTRPASRDRTAPFGSFSFSIRPLWVSVNVIVPSRLSIASSRVHRSPALCTFGQCPLAAIPASLVRAGLRGGVRLGAPRLGGPVPSGRRRLGMGRSLRHLQRHFVGYLALFLALGRTSFAAAELINGSQIKPHTIPKNRLTNSAIASLKGSRGPQGPAGLAGPSGPAGPIGSARAPGPPVSPAISVSAFPGSPFQRAEPTSRHSRSAQQQSRRSAAAASRPARRAARRSEPSRRCTRSPTTAISVGR